MKMAWEEINDLFARHGLAPPPVRLRDELVVHFVAYREMQRMVRATTPNHAEKDGAEALADCEVNTINTTVEA